MNIGRKIQKKKKKQNLFLALRIDQQKGRKPRNKSLHIWSNDCQKMTRPFSRGKDNLFNK